MDRTKPAWQYIGEMRWAGVVWFVNPHAFPLGTQYYAISGDATDMVDKIERLRTELSDSHTREQQLLAVLQRIAHQAGGCYAEWAAIAIAAHREPARQMRASEENMKEAA